MAETDSHRQLMTQLIEALEDWFAENKNVYVSGNLLIFYEEGNKRKHISPDVFVVKGVPKHIRPNYLMWEEGRGPNVAIELTSSSTRKEDTVKKLALYQDVLKIPEYFLFDPFGDYLKPQRLLGYRLTAGEYRPLRYQMGQIRSQQLGLILQVAGDTLRLVDPATSLQLPTRAEKAQAEAKARKAAESQAREESKLRESAQAEVERLRAELAKYRNGSHSTNGAHKRP